MAESSISVTSLPCAVCKFEKWNTEVESSNKFGHEHTIEKYEDLQKSVLSGCPGCIILHEAWVWCIPDQHLRSKAWLAFNIDTSKMYFHLFTEHVLDVDIFTLSGQPRIKHIASASLLPPSTELRYNLSRIQSWIEACERLHKRCSVVTEFTPFRLLDLQTDIQDCIKLVNVPNVRYVCLSHCWGSTRSKHLTKRENLLANQSGIPLLELPKTFQDAVHVTKALGIRYLWIDTFCIIQDDEKDWETQASLMAAIYENAYITIAAGSSDDDDGGFFAEPRDAYTKAYKFHLDVNGIDHEFYMRYAVPHPGEGWPVGRLLPLMTRAWTMQERLLAKRYLCFGHNEIFWECQEDVSCSCTIAEGPFNPCDGEPKFHGCEPLKYKSSLLNNLSSNDLATLWRDLVHEYSGRNLTKSSDKLPALAGLAEKFQRVFNCGYLAGLWMNNIREDVSWRTSGNDAPFGRMRKGPSWSWATACESPIIWPPIKLHKTFQVTSTSIHKEINGLTVHEYAKGSHLTIRGFIQPISIQTYVNRDELEKVYPLVRRCQVVEWARRHSEHSQLLARRFGSLVKHAERKPRDKAIEMDNDQEQTMYGTFFADYRFWETEEELRGTLQHVYFLFLGSETDTDPLWIDGMILRPRSGQWDESNVCYERIGWLRYCTLDSVTESDRTPRGTQSTITLL
ncbi:hypothetical protein FVEN_g4535 [Fusarium venenatum]|uniref:Heterokaryon incompatibility domain-containing protein n=1 Tax=Fusarium venenatum TaxID=56646 RepID=A0A2L2T5H3_9HYPO|nr:uncharacterized protein FVRRES_02566 [Fusarium venenatum]KAG8357961.1 hypothetical protein FVEN_g4535 [Fusarium venenatum]KAH7004338.1 heterokaryon incompatibility protein-domain-containing protein [Fusarium venenatum]CEI66054.1 unnamed protein product [Fusarium venenatum]